MCVSVQSKAREWSNEANVVQLHAITRDIIDSKTQ